MKTFVLIAALIGSHGSSQVTVPFPSLEACTRAAYEYKVTMEKDGAPGWAGNGGVLVKTMCVEAQR